MAPLRLAITGLGCLLPGASNPTELWNLRSRGGHAFAPLPKDRFDAAALASALPRPLTGVPWGAVVPSFDLDFRQLRLPPLQISQLHRMEKAALAAMIQALTDAGIERGADIGARARVFIGASTLGPDPLIDQRIGAERAGANEDTGARADVGAAFDARVGQRLNHRGERRFLHAMQLADLQRGQTELPEIEIEAGHDGAPRHAGQRPWERRRQRRSVEAILRKRRERVAAARTQVPQFGGIARAGQQTAQPGNRQAKGSQLRSGQALGHRGDHLAQRVVLTELECRIELKAKHFTRGTVDRHLLHRVDAEVGFEIEIQIEHLFGVAGALHHLGEDDASCLIEGR